MAKTKSDSDKDLLFSKILPALNENTFSSLHDEIPNPLETESPAQEDLLSALRSKLFARSSSYVPDSYVTINVMENLVLKHIDAAMQRFNACTCDHCRCRVAAYALNHLTPQYIVANSEYKEELIDAQTTKMVMDALVNAVLHVRANPKH
ncbi:late competence development ComFB family protein [Scatolibacter rhodanostii]|uniref:late competence development ComFB family protein n=1 Tax=Scatolibacter rhodanostii TaxID=2014781 RepID=UPI000C081837|nr:late competence development ComFB family protein [Scatolibacter rhodanostii]